MNPFYPEKTNGKPIQLNDRIRLEDGTSVTIREFLQMPGLGGGLTFGQISLGNLENVEDFTLTDDTILNAGRLSGNPKGEVFGTDPNQGGPIYHIAAATTFEQLAIIDLVIPEIGYVTFTIFEEGTDPKAIFTDNAITGGAAIAFAVFGGDLQVIYINTASGESTVDRLPSGAISNNVRLIIENNTITIEGIPTNVFALPFTPMTGVSIASVGIFDPVPASFFFSVMVGSNTEFTNPEDWAPGNFYQVTSGGQLYGHQFIGGDYLMVISDDQVIPFRFGVFITRLEIVGIISDTVDGYIVSAPVQELISLMVQNIINGMLFSETPLQQFVYNNARSDLHVTQYPNYGDEYLLDYDGPSKIFIPEEISNITVNVRIPLNLEKQRSFRIVIARSAAGSNRELLFFVRDTDEYNRAVEFGGDLPVIGNSQHYVGFSIPSEKAAIIDVDIWPDHVKAYIVGTLLGNSALDL